MANETMTLIATQTVGAGGTALLTFSSIPQTFTDLMLICSVRNEANSPEVNIYFNGANSNLTSRQLYGNGSSAASNNLGAQLNTYGGAVPSAYTANTFSSTQIYVPNYTSANYKSVSIDAVLENNSTSTYLSIVAGLWSSTAAITSLSYLVGGGDIAENSTFSLYGITKGSGGATVS